MEVFITMGTIDVSLYARDDGSPEITELKPPPGIFKPPDTDTEVFNQIKVVKCTILNILSRINLS